MLRLSILALLAAGCSFQQPAEQLAKPVREVTFQELKDYCLAHGKAVVHIAPPPVVVEVPFIDVPLEEFLAGGWEFADLVSTGDSHDR